MPDEFEARLAALGLSLPSPPGPAANYVPFCLAGNLLYIAGQLPRGPSGIVHPGRLGAEVSIEQGQEAARLCGLNIPPRSGPLSAIWDVSGDVCG
jgi:enamine deaminase RidA (YjgF/YER057c/UK114 family)